MLILAFCLGVTSCLYFGQVVELYYCVAALVFLLPGIYWLPSYRRLLLCSLLVVLGFSWTNYRALQQLSWHLPKQLISQTVVVEGNIASIPNSKGDMTRFVLQTHKIANESHRVLLQLSWYGRHPPLLAGSDWRLAVRLKPPHGLMNPGGFNYQRWLWGQGTRATGYVTTKPSPVLLSNHLNSRWFLLRFREKIQQAIIKAQTNPATAGIISALAIGSRSGISQQQWQVLRNTGTSHLVAISGLHIGLVAAVMYFLLLRLWSLWSSASLKWPAPKVAAIAALLAAFIYSALAGFSLPTQRALIMITVLMLGQLFMRWLPSWHRLLLAVGIVVVWDPWCLWSASFWLSFMAVAWIAYGMRGHEQQHHHWHSHWRRSLRLQWVVTLGLAPITLYFFQQLSVSAFPANLIAIPWVSFVLVPLILLAIMVWLIYSPLGLLLFNLAGKALMPLWFILETLARLPGSHFNYAISSLWQLVLVLVCLVLFFSVKKIFMKSLIIAGILVVILYPLPSPKAGEVWMSVLDVGQGLAVVVRTKEHTLIYDAGPSFHEAFDSGSQIIMPFLRVKGISKIDKLMISHDDNDHSGGAASLVASGRVKRLITPSVKLRHKLGRQSTISVIRCQTGLHWQWNGINFRVLYPSKTSAYQGNNSSCVLQIDTGKQKILLSGDIEAKAEQYLLKKYGHQIQSAVLVAPHHGSCTSSTEEFVKTVAPREVIFSAGFYNRYHFPAREVIDRYRRLGSELWTTAEQGAILVKINRVGKISVQGYADRLSTFEG